MAKSHFKKKYPMKGKRTYKKYYKKKYGGKTSVFKESATSVEIKNVDNANTVITPATTTWFAPTLMNNVVLGSLGSQRIGRRLTNTSMQYRFTYGGATSGTAIRILVVYDKQPNNVAPTVLSIMNIDDFNSPLQLANTERFLVISDKIFTQAQDGGPNLISGKDYRKVALDSVFSGNTGAIADLSTGAFWVMAACNSASAGSVNIYTRMRFKDA